MGAISAASVRWSEAQLQPMGSYCMTSGLPWWLHCSSLSISTGFRGRGDDGSGDDNDDEDEDDSSSNDEEMTTSQ